MNKGVIIMKLVEFCGIFNAGKFSLIGRLKERLSKLGYSIHSIQADRSIPGEFTKRGDHLGREMSVLTETVKSIIHVLDAHKADIVILHRGPWDAIAHLQGLTKAGLITKDEARAGIVLAQAYTAKIDLVVLVEISAQISLGRSCLPDASSDSIRDIDTLKALFSAYHALKSKLPKNSLVIDGAPSFGSSIFRKNLESIFEEICSLNCGNSLKEATILNVT